MSSTIFEQLFVSKNIVHIAALLYLCGFLFRDQLILRGLILVGDLVYILYFYFAPEEPLWGGHRMVSEAKTFIGEIAFRLSRPATARVTLETGCHYCVGDSKALHNVHARR